MYILACGEAGAKLKDLIWLKEFTHITEFETLKTKAKKNKEYKDKVFIMFSLLDYTDSRSGNIELLKILN